MFKGTHKKIRNIKHRTVTKSPTKDFREKVIRIKIRKR